MIAAPSSLLCDIGACAASQDVVNSMLGAVGSALSGAADWMVTNVVSFIARTTQPGFASSWVSGPATRMETVAALVALPVLMVATVGAVLRQDGRRLARVWGVGLPVAVLAGMAAPALAQTGLLVTEELCRVVAGPNYELVAHPLAGVLVDKVLARLPVFVTILVSAITMAGALLIWLELSLRMAAIYVTVLFMPVALVTFIWPATAGMAKRAVELLGALILSKFVIVACLVIGLAAMKGTAAGGVVAGAGIVLMAAFAPFALLRLAPVVEAAAIAHLEGLSRRPLQAAGAAATTVAAAGSHPVAQLLLSSNGGGGGGTSAAETVRPRGVPEHAADFPVGDV